MDSNAIEQLANSWFNSWGLEKKDTCHTCNTCHTLPISKLDGVRVDVKILFMDTGGVWLRLVVDSMVKTDFECDGENMYFSYYNDKNTLHHAGKNMWDVEMMGASILALQNLIGLLKYNKMADDFRIGEDYKKKQDVQLEVWSVNKNSEMNGDMCCVCHDRTICETDCGHHLCQQCWCSLKKEQENGENGHKCPVCRNFMCR